MQTHELIAHPDHPPAQISRIVAGISAIHPHWIELRWRIEGAGQVVVPKPAGKRRQDGLWQTTCFELFVDRAEGYSEFNFSPSERWAAYDFTGYREGMAERAMPREPVCTWRGGASGLALFDVAVPRAGLPEIGRFGLSAVIEEQGGTKSYWALAHPPGKPDFHHRACFADRLAPPEVP